MNKPHLKPRRTGPDVRTGVCVADRFDRNRIAAAQVTANPLWDLDLPPAAAAGLLASTGLTRHQLHCLFPRAGGNNLIGWRHMVRMLDGDNPEMRDSDRAGSRGGGHPNAVVLHAFILGMAAGARVANDYEWAVDNAVHNLAAAARAVAGGMSPDAVRAWVSGSDANWFDERAEEIWSDADDEASRSRTRDTAEAVSTLRRLGSE